MGITHSGLVIYLPVFLWALGMPWQASAASTLEPQPAEIMPRAVASTLLDISHTGKRFIVAGDRGHILISDDGENWTQVHVPVRAMLNRIRMQDADKGWVVGHDATILKTTDGGRDWELKHFDPEWGKPFYDIHFFDDQNGMVIGANGRVMKTSDGGEVWEDVEGEVFDLGLHLNVILELGDGTLFIAGERSVLARSMDQGETWTLLTSPYSGSWFNALPYGDSGVIAFGLRGNAYITENIAELPVENIDEWDEYSVETKTDPEVLSAMGWRPVENPVVQSLFGGSKYDGSKIVLVGVNGTIMKGDLDEGKLSPVDSRHDAPLSSAIVRNNKLYVVGRNGVDAIEWQGIMQ